MFMFNTVEEFKSEWQTESDFTRKILAVLTDESLKYSAVADHRTVGRMAWHIVLTLSEMSKGTGLNIDGPSEQDPVPGSAETIKQAYDKAAKSLVEEVANQWTDESLQVEDEMYGEKWKRGYTLYGVIKHEIHHRAQLTVLLRLAGLAFPGVYGPAKEEWSQYNMPAPGI